MADEPDTILDREQLHALAEEARDVLGYYRVRARILDGQPMSPESAKIEKTLRYPLSEVVDSVSEDLSDSLSCERVQRRSSAPSFPTS